MNGLPRAAEVVDELLAEDPVVPPVAAVGG
jgi:hypothetical protein